MRRRSRATPPPQVEAPPPAAPAGAEEEEEADHGLVAEALGHAVRERGVRRREAPGFRGRGLPPRFHVTCKSMLLLLAECVACGF